MTNGDGHSPSWPLIARWAVGISVALVVAISGFYARQSSLNAEMDARQDREMIELRGRVTAMQDITLDGLRYEMARLANSIDKLEDRLRLQEIKSHGDRRGNPEVD